MQPFLRKKCDYINENNLTESRRREKVENAESFTLSAESTKDSNVLDCYEFNKLNSRNDDCLPSYRLCEEVRKD